MKKSILLFAVIIMMAGVTTTVMAQATASATGTATIIAPITLLKTVDMNFGYVAVIGAGTVILDPAGARTKTGGVTLPLVSPGTVTAASFTVGGQGSTTYSITLPSSDYYITRQSGSEAMVINTFTSIPATTGTIDAGGTQTLTVGATLHVAAAQVPGVYTNTIGFDVTVNYN